MKRIILLCMMMVLWANNIYYGDLRAASLKYPSPRKVEHEDDYFGVKIADPYRWMEDINSKETTDWIQQQQLLTKDYYSGIKLRKALQSRLTQLWDYERYTVPYYKAGKIFYKKNSGLQQQYALYMQDSLSSKPKVLLDPNTFSDDGTISLKKYSISSDGQMLAYGISVSGSDWEEWSFKNIQTGKVFKDRLKWIKFSDVVWAEDGGGVFYSRYDEPAKGEVLEQVNTHNKLYYHKLGTQQSEDQLIYSRTDKPGWRFDPVLSSDDRYLIIYVYKGTHREKGVFYQDLHDPNADVVELFNRFDAFYEFKGSIGTKFFFQTNLHAPNSRVVLVDINKPTVDNWREVIPESDLPIESSEIVGGRIFVEYLKDVMSQVKVYDLDGKNESQIQLPGLGDAWGFKGSLDDRETFFGFDSYIQPKTFYRYDIASGKFTIFYESKLKFDKNDYISEQVFYKSQDGTQIPMTISYKKGLRKSAHNPTILYGYGGFNISLTPGFSAANLVWMELGGVYAVANLRGGGEYGDGWHNAGKLHNKQNVFDDFYAAAEYLINQKYTSSQKLAIYGGSNGGLLVGAAITQRPELFAVAAPSVGVMDMLRFQYFTIGWAWVSDYGSSENKDDFDILIKYSPLHNLKPRVYPPTLILTSEQDDRVVPSHSFKFGATMQEVQQGDAPIIVRIESKAGHGSGTATSKAIEKKTDLFAFFLHNMGIDKIPVH